MNIRHPTESQIRTRAYEIYQEHGCQQGHDVDHWLQAEYELMQLPIEKIAELPTPRQKRGRAARHSLVGVVHAALVMGADTLLHLHR